MGGTNSVEIDPSLLNSLRYRDEGIVAHEIIKKLEIKNETELTAFAILIFNAAEANREGTWMAVKFAKLVWKLSEVKVTDPKKGQITFKDAFTNLIVKKLEAYNMTFFQEEVVLTFLGELFNNGVYSATMMCFWLKSLGNVPHGKKQLLNAIREKVESELKKPEHESAIDSIKIMMTSYGVGVARPASVALPPANGQQSAQVPGSYQRAAPATAAYQQAAIATAAYQQAALAYQQPSSIANYPGLYTSNPHKAAAAPVYESSSSDDYQHDEEDDYSSYEEEASQYDYNNSESSYSQSQSAQASFPDLFHEFLSELEENPKLTFRFRRFKTCSEDDRKECAEILLNAVITRPKIIKPATFAIRTIQANPPNNQHHLKFMDYLEDLVESKVCHLLKQKSKWTPLKNIGIFLALLNNMNCITNATMDIWLDAMQVPVSKNNVSATNIFLEILKVTLDHMKTKNPKKFEFCVLELLRISNKTGYKPPKLTQWMDKVIKNNLKAVRNASPTLPELFQKFLVDLKQNPSQAFDLKLFKTCSEDDRKKCAQLALDAVVADPKIIEPLSCIMQTIQCSMTPNNVNHLKLSDHLSILIEAKIEHLVKQESKWKPLEIIGNFLADLYNLECIKNATMDKWFDGLQPFVDNTNVKGTNVYVSVLKLILEKLKSKNLAKFKFHLLQLQNLKPTVWLSPELQEWKGNLRRLYPNVIIPSTNNVTNIQQQSTGAIRKTTNVQAAVVPQVPPIVPASIMTIQLKPPCVPATVMTIQQKLDKMYANHDALQILDEIVALRVEMSATNLRKLTNIMTSKVISRPDIIKSSVDILANLPHRSIPPFDKKELKNPLKLSLMDQLFHLQREAKPNEDRFFDILKFVTLLLSKNVIDTEIITEMTERLAVTARSNEKFPLTVLITFLETYSACLMTKTDQLKETKITLNQHRISSSSSEVRKRVEEALKLTTYKSGTPEIQKKNVDCPPSTSSACVAIDNKKKFLALLLELPSKSIKDIKIIAGQIKSPGNREDFIAALCEAAMKTEQFSLYAEIAQIVEQELESVANSNSFNESLLKFLYASYSPLTQLQMKTSRGVENRAKFIGEFYKIQWIEIDVLTTVMDKLSETEVLVQLFYTLLNIVALSVAKNGDGEQLAKYRTIYATRQDGYMDSTTDYLACRKVIRMLDDIAALTTKRVLFDAKAVKTVIDDLNMKNIEEQAIKIESLSKGTGDEFEMIVNAILNKLAECDDELMASFSCKLLEVFKESKAQLKQKFVDKCNELLPAKFLQPEEAKSHNAFTLIAFFGKLYTINILDSNFIALCFEILVGSENENKNVCLCILMSAVGAKLDAEDRCAVSIILRKLDIIIEEEGTESFLAEKMRNLIDLRENGWKSLGTSNRSQHSIVLLENLARSNLTSSSTCKEIARLCESSPRDLVVSFYFSVIRNPDKADLYADLCGIVQKQEPAFKEYLKEYLSFSIVSAADLKRQDCDEETQSDLAATTIFIGELFVRNLIDDDSLAFLLKPAKNLRFDSINHLVSVIGEKVSGGNNIRLKALLMCLEEVAQDETKQFWDDLKRDIDEITEAVSRSNAHRSEVTAEASDELS